MNNKTKLLNLAFIHFVSSEELWRSWPVSIKQGLRTTDYGRGLGIKYGLGIKRGLENTDWV